MPFMTIPLNHKTAVVTGAAGGLGRALALELHAHGCHLALIDRDRAGLEALQSAIDRQEQRVTIHCIDVSDEAAVARARMEVLAVHTDVDLLINNAGISVSRRFADLDEPDFQRVMAVNFWGAVYCSRHFLPDLKTRPHSRLVNISSDFALLGFPGKTAYGASKGALNSFTCSLQTELAGAAPRVCLVIPPPMPTGLVRDGGHSNPAARAVEMDFLTKNGMPPARAAARIIWGIRRGQGRIVVGSMMFWVDACSRFFPTILHRWIGRNKSFKRFA